MSKYFTIPGFSSLSAQEVFDTSVKHVLANGRPSMLPNNTCCYSGIGCAAAPLLKWDKRQAADDLSGTWQLLVDSNLVPTDHDDLICRLQLCHDTNANGISDEGRDYIFLAKFTKAARKVAEDFNLDASALD